MKPQRNGRGHIAQQKFLIVLQSSVRFRRVRIGWSNLEQGTSGGDNSQVYEAARARSRLLAAVHHLKFPTDSINQIALLLRSFIMSIAHCMHQSYIPAVNCPSKTCHTSTNTQLEHSANYSRQNRPPDAIQGLFSHQKTLLLYQTMPDMDSPR